MDRHFYTNLQIREVFHIAFLRAFSKKVKPALYSLKGGVNMRLFFHSFRYSEDMDLDVNTISVSALRDIVANIINSVSFRSEVRSYGISDIQLQDMAKAKQTQTTQRFKIHLITHQAEDLFTKIEFSRRESSGTAIAASVSENILRQYKMMPLIVSHYDILSAVKQKVSALANRKAVQARDIFDLYILSTQLPHETGKLEIDALTAKTACDNTFLVKFDEFQSKVVEYLADEDKTNYSTSTVWDEICLKVHELICPRT